jgi:hypothetical protein
MLTTMDTWRYQYLSLCSELTTSERFVVVVVVVVVVFKIHQPRISGVLGATGLVD